MFYTPSRVQEEQFIDSYIQTAVWVNSVEPDTFEELREEALAALEDEHLVRLVQCAQARSGDIYGWEQAGNDFYLTREGHGAGFWDRGLGIVGEALTEVARRWGSSEVLLDQEEVWS